MTNNSEAKKGHRKLNLSLSSEEKDLQEIPSSINF